MAKQGRKKGTKAKKAILLDYRSWIIEYDASAWPSDSFILRKKGARCVAYCGTLESALKKLYNSMLGDYVNRVNDYGAKFEDLANAIIDVKNDFSAILQHPEIKNCIKTHESKNKEALIE